MNILFIWPGTVEMVLDINSKNLFRKFRTIFRLSPRPLTFPILAALTPKHHNIDIIEIEPTDKDYNKSYDLVAITCTTAYAPLAYKIADNFRMKGVTVVLGGWHPSVLPDEAKQHADSVVIGEAEESWPKLLEDFDNKTLKPFYIPQRPVPPELIPHPINIYPKNIKIELQGSRGCPNGCEFCAITNMKFRNIHRVRPVDDIIEDFKRNSGKVITLIDNSLTVNLKYSKELFSRLKGLNKKFVGYGTIDSLGNDEFLNLAREAGCIGWEIGFESVSSDSLRSVGKKTNTVEMYQKNVKKIHDYGMSVIGFFVFGFDYDKKDIFEKTREVIEKCDIDTPIPLVLTPLPGTPLFNRLEKEGRILTKDWSKYDYSHVVFKPKNISAQELYTKTKELHKVLYSNKNIIKRIYRKNNYSLSQKMSITIGNIIIKYAR